MAKRINKKEYFEVSADTFAKWLLGKILCHKIGVDIYRWRIIETEAYSEKNDKCCRTGDDYKSVGKIIFDGGNGLNITCNSATNCDNVLIRGALNTIMFPIIV